MRTKAVLFDFDGTLADTLPVIFHAFQTVFRRHDRREVSPDEIIGMFGPPEEGILRKELSHCGSLEEAVKEFYHLYEENHTRLVRPSGDIRDLLAFLRDRSYRTAVITGKGRRTFEISARELGLSDAFDVTITGNDVEKAKPDPEGILRALDELGAAKEEAVFLGDSDADIAAGKAAGLRTYGVLWLPTTQASEFREKPDAVFRRTAQLRELLEGEAG
ncbi:HAD-IA family hydrolase [Paenibacillus aurantius]|uniref:HAD-IA family hydrolase n=1 Tax=Paenibacillus aurantius TaxID=2918900 RepID=A0AA96RGC2_9BACL|nr:HAD-IA family hydrolase [Paenibacillus aurantius]WNQ12371.1 HAD-IA family hydrolase [Paenibacillus aurantius]